MVMNAEIILIHIADNHRAYYHNGYLDSKVDKCKIGYHVCD